MRAREILAAARVRVLNRYPYFDSLAFSLRPVEKAGLGTLAVDADLRLYYDPATVQGWGPEATASVLYHEVGHVLRDHHGRLKDLDPRLSNWAGDLEINDDVLRSGWKLPGKPLLPADFGYKEGLTAEEYYSLLPKAPEDSRAGGASDGDPSGSPAPGCGGRCGGTANNPGPEGRGEGGSEGLPPGATPGEIAVLRRQVAQRILSSGRGSQAGLWERWARQQLEPPKIPWQRILRARLRSCLAWCAGRVDYTLSRISRSYWGQREVVPGIPLRPGMRSPRLRASVVLDCSGSMSGAPYLRALAEVMGVVRALQVPVRVLATDTMVQRRQDVLSSADLERVGFSGGGTDMPEGIREADRDRPDVIVVLTDGQTAWPAPDEMPRAELVVCLVRPAEMPGHIRRWVQVEE